MGVWSGFDDGSKTLNGSVTMNNYHKNVWKAVMDRINAGKPATPFTQPGSVTACYVCPLCGKLAIPGVCELDENNKPYMEYFTRGTEPTEKCDCHMLIHICAESDCEANPWCVATYSKLFYDMPPTDTVTVDSPYIYRYDENPPMCYIHKEPETTEEETTEESTDAETDTETDAGDSDTDTDIDPADPLQPGDAYDLPADPDLP